MSGERHGHRWLDRATRRPLLTVAVIGAAVAVLEAIWIMRFRPAGSFDIDEAGYLASALRFERNLADGPRALAAVVGSTENGPLTPLLSVPFLLVGPRTAATAMLVQPVLHVVCALGVAGIAGRMASGRAAVVAGVVTLGAPAALVSAHSYQFGLATSSTLALALWALLASERGHRRAAMLAFGAAVGALLLTRTMTLGFLPGLAAAVAVTVRRDRTTATNLGLASVATVAVAAPWWIIAWPSVSSYLLRNGYGNRSQYWGRTTLAGRIDSRFDLVLRDVKPLQLVLGAIVVGLAVASLAAWIRTGGDWRRWPGWPRGGSALVALVVLGYAALLSTSNTGSWFDLPLELLGIGYLVALAARMPSPRRDATTAALVGAAVVAVGILWVGRSGRLDVVLVATAVLTTIGSVTVACLRSANWRRILAGFTVAVALATVVSADFDRGGYIGDRDALRLRTFLVGGIADVQAGNFEADPRLATTDGETRSTVSAEWAGANDAVVHLLQDYVDRYGDIVVTLSGSGHLMSINTLLLASELADTGYVGFDVPDTTASEATVRSHLTPTATKAHAGESRGVHAFDERIRVVVVVRGRSLPFPDDRQGPRFERIARSDGWSVRDTVPLPDGGDVLVYDLDR